MQNKNKSWLFYVGRHVTLRSYVYVDVEMLLRAVHRSSSHQKYWVYIQMLNILKRIISMVKRKRAEKAAATDTHKKVTMIFNLISPRSLPLLDMAAHLGTVLFQQLIVQQTNIACRVPLLKVLH